MNRLHDMRTPIPSGWRTAGVAALWIAAVLTVVTGCARPAGNSRSTGSSREKILLADRMIQAENFPEAVRVLNEAARVDASNPEIHYYLGVGHFYLGEYPEAEKSLRESLRLNKRNADAHNALGLVYTKLGQRERALEEYRQALADPSYRTQETSYLNMALCLDDMGRTEEAILNLRRAVEKEPKYYAAHWELAKLLDRQEQTREAIEEYEVAAPQYASDPNYHYRLGLAYFREHRMDRAREHLSKVVAAMPGTEKALEAKKYLDLMSAEPVRTPPGVSPGTGRP